MTKKEALKLFRQYWLPHVRAEYELDGQIDHIARRETWNNYVDSLALDGDITQHQLNTWTNPY